MKAPHTRLVEWCERWQVSRGLLADRLGRDPSYASHLLAGRIRPSLEVAVAIARMTRGDAEGPILPEDWIPAGETKTAA